MAFRSMRRHAQQLTETQCVRILECNTAGVLAVTGDEGYPYAVPLSYMYADGCIYFHCARQGHKLDAIRQNSKVSFCVVDQDEIVPEKFTTYYRSVIVFGRAQVLEAPEAIAATIDALALKYAPDSAPAHRQQEIASSLDYMVMVRVIPEHMTGKEAIELVRRRKENP